jgi:hypothetical protein
VSPPTHSITRSRFPGDELARLNTNAGLAPYSPQRQMLRRAQHDAQIQLHHESHHIGVHLFAACPQLQTAASVGLAAIRCVIFVNAVWSPLYRVG